jgi:hypothetical protein
MCEAWNEAGEATQTVRVTIKGREFNITQKKNNEKFVCFKIEKRGKAKRVRKAPPKTAPKDEEPSKKDQRKQALEQPKPPEIGKFIFSQSNDYQSFPFYSTANYRNSTSN